MAEFFAGLPGIAWWGGIASILSFVVGITGIVLWARARIGPRPKVITKSLRLLGHVDRMMSPEVEVYFKKQRVPRLTRASVYVWNAGKKVLPGELIVPSEPLRCEFEPGDQIFEPEIISFTKKANNVSAVRSEGQGHILLINFAYLNPGDGVRIDYLHTSEMVRPVVKGEFMGVRLRSQRQPLLVKTMKLQSFIRKIIITSRIIPIFYLVLGIAMLAWGAYDWIKGVPLSEPSIAMGKGKSTTPLTNILLGSLVSFLGWTMWRMTRKPYPSILDKAESLDRKNIE